MITPQEYTRNIMHQKSDIENNMLEVMDVVSVAERSDDRRSSTTKSGASFACWGLLRISTHILNDDSAKLGVQMNMKKKIKGL